MTGLIYRGIIKPILFLFPADDVHTFFLKFGRFLGKYRCFWACASNLWNYKNKRLEQKVSGLHFVNPVGLAAGFDYNADLVGILPSVGFGLHTVGTLTLEPYGGNPRPMLGRLPKSQSLLVNKGFKNAGVQKVLSSLSANKSQALRGVSIGATNKIYDSYESMVQNLITGFKQADSCPYFDYFELNISCPNLDNIKNLSDQIASPSGLRKVLESLSLVPIARPIFVKMPLERSEEQIRELIDVIVPFTFIKGLVLSNLAKDRTNSWFDADEISKAGYGNFSGKPVEQKSNELIRFAYKYYRERFVIIGVGGIFDAQDAYRKIRSGATLLQLITGMIYRGPQLIGEINQGLVKLLEKDGFKNISEAIGADVKI